MSADRCMEHSTRKQSFKECPSSSVLKCVRKNRTVSLRTGNGVGELGKSPMHSDNNATQRALGWLEFVRSSQTIIRDEDEGTSLFLHSCLILC